MNALPVPLLRQVSGDPFFPSFFNRFCKVVLGHFVVRFWVHFGSLLVSLFHFFFILKIDRFFYVFWGAFWVDFGGPDRRKLSSRVHETLILLKAPFSSQERLLMQNGFQNEAKIEPKGHSTSTKKLMHFLIEKMIGIC